MTGEVKAYRLMATVRCPKCGARFGGYLDEQEIVDRASRKAESWQYLRRWCAGAAIVVLVGITEPVHTWLRQHLQFVFGMVVGSLIQAVPWLRDRWLWVKWFSHQ